MGREFQNRVGSLLNRKLLCFDCDNRKSLSKTDTFYPNQVYVCGTCELIRFRAKAVKIHTTNTAIGPRMQCFPEKPIQLWFLADLCARIKVILRTFYQRCTVEPGMMTHFNYVKVTVVTTVILCFRRGRNDRINDLVDFVSTKYTRKFIEHTIVNRNWNITVRISIGSSAYCTWTDYCRITVILVNLLEKCALADNQTRKLTNTQLFRRLDES